MVEKIEVHEKKIPWVEVKEEKNVEVEQEAVVADDNPQVEEIVIVDNIP